MAKVIHIEGDRRDAEGVPMKEELELWMQNPVECVAELMSNPAFKESMAYASQHLTDDKGGSLVARFWLAQVYL
jgi:hypothetical protein